MKKYNYPETKKIHFEENFFGETLKDPYVWLEKAKDKEVLEWVKSQNKFTDQYFTDEQKYNVEKLSKEIKKKSKSSKYMNIIESFGKIYATKQNEKGERSIVILDQDFKEKETLIDSKTFDNKMMLLGITPSPINNGIAFVSAMVHSSTGSLIIYDCNKKKTLRQIDNVFGASFSSMGDKVYFTERELVKSEYRSINRIKIYDVQNDTIESIYEHDKNSLVFTLTPSQCGQYIGVNMLINYADKELSVIDTTDNSIVKLTGDAIGSFEYIGTIEDKHYVKTNVEAEYGKILCFPVSNPSYEASYDVIPHSDKIISHAVIVKDKIIVSYMVDVVSVMSVYDKEGKYLYDIDLPSNMGTIREVMGISTRGITESPNLYIPFESFTDVPSIIQYNVNTHQSKTVIREKEVKIPDDIIVTRQFITARDGVKIPTFIVHKKDVSLDGNNPTLMYGYGGYNVAMPPSFHNFFIAMDIWEWVDKGYVYVNCNIRGGNEYGKNWHRQGNLENKKNVFNDFIDITEWLIDNKWTKPEKIAIVGGSNGGLLMTALITMRPDLWGAVIASVPHTDMIRFKNDDTGPSYITEYGNPNDENMFEYMLSYSPYHNIKKVAYPPIYIQTGELDNNVPPYHTKKFAAKMQELNQSENPVLLRVLAEGAHDKGKGDVMYKTTAEMQTFIARVLKL